jgi:hypothetical protein
MPSALQDGKIVSGRNGNLVYRGGPVQLSAAERDRLKDFQGTVAILLTRQVGTSAPEWGYFLVAGGGSGHRGGGVLADEPPHDPAAGRGGGRSRGGSPRASLESRVPIRDGDYSEFVLPGQLHQRDGAEPAGRPYAGASSPLVGVARPAHATDLYPGLRRGHRRRRGRGHHEGGRRHHRRIAPAGAPGGRPARPDQTRGPPALHEPAGD